MEFVHLPYPDHPQVTITNSTIVILISSYGCSASDLVRRGLLYHYLAFVVSILDIYCTSYNVLTVGFIFPDEEV
jgi:hypothetical protein